MLKLYNAFFAAKRFIGFAFIVHNETQLHIRSISGKKGKIPETKTSTKYFFYKIFGDYRTETEDNLNEH